MSWRALLTLLVAGAMLLGAGSAAQAHDQLTDSSPAAGEELSSPPSEVHLTFSGEVLELGAVVTVLDDDGGTWEAGEPVIDGQSVTAPLTEGMPGGAYEIQWRVSSSDGHPISGSIPFTVEAAEPTTEPAAPSSSDPATEESTSTEAPVSEDADNESSESEVAQTTEAPETAASDAETESTTSGDDSDVPWVAIVLGVVVLIGLGALAAVRRRGTDS
ncbi:copper resistance CopC family protein [Ornithinimicrobium murale]|uniref:copper resistance CopC family protein n=1 Tax=Ornithinimicrobium murale TaxID=1050153 RepID=UPI0013B3E410|nr:copper resistance CopC family protein [Ornithinimicrobium murale]